MRAFFSCRGIQINAQFAWSTQWEHTWANSGGPGAFHGTICFDDVGDNCAERRGSTMDSLLDPCCKPADVAEVTRLSSHRCQIDSRCRSTTGQHSQEMKVTAELPRLRSDLGMQGNMILQPPSIIPLPLQFSRNPSHFGISPRLTFSAFWAAGNYQIGYRISSAPTITLAAARTLLAAALSVALRLQRRTLVYFT